MERKSSNADELIQFIDDTRNGKYTEDTFSFETTQEVRCEYEVIEDVNRVSENVILYGLSY